jgi:hypothetical protein
LALQQLMGFLPNLAIYNRRLLSRVPLLLAAGFRLILPFASRS